MKSHFSHFLHHTLSHSDVNAVSTPSLSHSDVNAVSTPSLSHSGLTGVSRSNKVANLFHLDYRVKPDNDSICAGRSRAPAEVWLKCLACSLLSGCFLLARLPVIPRR